MEFLPALSELRGLIRSALAQTDLSATSMKGMVSLLESRLGCAEGAIYADKDARRHCKAIINDLIPEVQAEQVAAAKRKQKHRQSDGNEGESGESDGWGEAAESEDDFAPTGPKGRKRANEDAGGGRKKQTKKKKAAVAAAVTAPTADALAAHKVGC